VQAAHQRSSSTAHSHFTTRQPSDHPPHRNNNSRPDRERALQLTTVDMRQTGSHFTEDSKEIRELRVRMGLDSEGVEA
jgi:hypothetical protein